MKKNPPMVRGYPHRTRSAVLRHSRVPPESKRGGDGRGGGRLLIVPSLPACILILMLLIARPFHFGAAAAAAAAMSGACGRNVLPAAASTATTASSASDDILRSSIITSRVIGGGDGCEPKLPKRRWRDAMIGGRIANAVVGSVGGVGPRRRRSDLVALNYRPRRYVEDDDSKRDGGGDGDGTNMRGGQGAERDYTKETQPARRGLTYKEKPKPILVVGATGRVGRRVVRQLLEDNVPVRAYVRDYDRAVDVFGRDDATRRDSSLILDVGDLNDPNSLERAVRGCDYVISVSGTVRPSRLTDFLPPWRLFRVNVSSWCDDMTHPYYVNYVSQKRLFDLCEKHGVKKVVRLTDLYTGMPAFSFISVLVNALRSMTFRYHSLAEQALRNGTVPYVILRPGDLSDYERDTDTTSIQVDASGVLPSPSMIGRTDVASLAIAALRSDDPRNYTLAVRWAGEHMYPQSQGRMEEGCHTAKQCLEELKHMTDVAQVPEEERLRSGGGRFVRTKPFAAFVALTVYTAMILVGRAAFLAGKRSLGILAKV